MLSIEELGGVGLHLHIAEAAILFIIGAENNGVFAGLMHGDQNVVQRVAEVEVEHEHQTVAVKCTGLLGALHQQHVGHALIEHVVLLGQGNHILVKLVQPLIFQGAVVLQAPLTAAVVEAPAVAFSGEVDPFGMTEFVAHEVQIAFTAAGQGEQADDLVQSNSTVDGGIVAVLVHVGVHIGTGQTEDHGLVTHQSLVVGFHIGNGFLTGAAQAHIAPHLVDIPELILALDCFDPHIRQTHAQTVVKADTAIRNGQSHAGHTGHILGDGNGVGVHLTDQLVGQLQVGDCFRVGVVGEVLVVGVEVGTQTMVMVEHGGDTVETEAVEVVLGHPELQIAEQEVQNAGLAIVEALGAPGGVLALVAVMEELPGGAVEHIDALGSVLDSVGMDYVQQNPDAQLVSFVHQVLQVLGLAEPGGGCIEVGDLVAEGAVVGMLHNGHQLDGVVTGFLDMGQGIVGELTVGTHLALFLGHTYVGFVDVQILFTLETGIGPVELLAGVNDLSLKGVVGLVLHGTAAIQGQVLGAGHVGVHNGLDLAAVPQSVFAFQEQLPVAVADGLQGVGGLVPVVEFAFQIQCVSAGSPLAVDPAALHTVEAVEIVCVRKVVQGLAFIQQSLFGAMIEEHTQIDIACKALELGIQF